MQILNEDRTHLIKRGYMYISDGSKKRGVWFEYCEGFSVFVGTSWDEAQAHADRMGIFKS